MQFFQILSVVASAMSSVMATGDAFCVALCQATPDCQNDPHDHCSYCKHWQTPSVCFGLYWLDQNETTACFEPHDPNGVCDDAVLSPVLCA